MATTTEITPVPCPVCGDVLDAATSVAHGNVPTPGSFSFCAGCLAPLRFYTGPLGNLLLRLIHDDEIELARASGLDRWTRLFADARRRRGRDGNGSR